MKNYRVTWRFTIDAFNKMTPKSRKYLMPKWSIFMKSIMAKPKTPDQYVEMSEIRKVLPSNFSVESIYNSMRDKDPELFRLFVDVSEIFNLLPSDLKVFILSVFGVTSHEISGIVRNTTLDKSSNTL